MLAELNPELENIKLEQKYPAVVVSGKFFIKGTHTVAALRGQISRRRAETHQTTEEGRYECGDESEMGRIAVYTLG